MHSNTAFDFSRIVRDLGVIREAILRSEPTKPGLLNGELGTALYCAHEYASRRCKNTNELTGRIEMALEFCMSQYRKNPPSPIGSLASGLTGLAITISQLLSLGLLDYSTDLVLRDVEDTLCDLVKEYLANGNKFLGYDYFYGICGPANYFLSYSKSTKRKELVRGLCLRLVDQAADDDKGLKWRDEFGFSRLPYNLGMAHGMLSIMCILSKAVYRLGADELKTDLCRSIDWYLGQENTASYPCRFSASTDDEGHGKDCKNWIAWCSGDLSVSLMLLHAYRATGNRHYVDRAISIADSTLSRRDINKEVSNNGQTFNVSLCHGIAGVAACYLSLARALRIRRYRLASVYWTHQLFRRSNSIDFDSCAGCYQMGPKVSADNWTSPSLTLLDGAAGVGLLYSSILHPKLSKFWFPLFFLDIAYPR